MSDFVKEAVKIAKEIGHYQLEQLHNPRQIEYKGVNNLVTEVDKACEKKIIAHIKDHFPSHDIVAEEGGGHNTKSDWCWFVDPLDGTTNYTHRYPLFSVSLGLLHRGEKVVGVVYEPNRDELFVAEKGGGSSLNGKKIRVSKSDQLITALLSTGFPYDAELMQRGASLFTRMLFQSRAVRRDGVASTDLCYVACGRFDGFWEKGLFAWDVAAGSLIVEEAGGVVSNIDGSPLGISKGEIVASNGLLHAQILKVLQQES